ncbi:MAG: DUF4440 domain-containing protein [Gemmatimonadales bacterium]|nr:DUF4440 domain-containing protein [Gemmatimonadales bacterium]
MRIVLALFLAGFALPSCRPAQAPQPDEAEIRAAVTARVDGYVQAIRDLDLSYMEGFWADVEGFTVAGDGVLTAGYSPWIEQLRSLVTSIESVSYVEISDPRVYVLGPDAASYSMAYRWSFNMKDGSVLSAKGSWMYVFRRFQDAWKVVHSAGAHVYS